MQMTLKPTLKVRKLRPDEYKRLDRWSIVNSMGETGCWWGGLSLIAEYEGQIIGFLEYFGVNLENIWVVPGYRGHGVGTHLLHAFAQLRVMRPLIVPFAPAPLVPFLERRGFVVDSSSQTDGLGVRMYCYALTPVQHLETSALLLPAYG